MPLENCSLTNIASQTSRYTHHSRSRLSALDMMMFSLPSYPRVTAYIVVVARFAILS